MKTDIRYTSSGYIDMRALIDHERSPFIFITGARGAGKTWGALDYMIRCQHDPFILMRRTQVQADFAGAIESTPLAANLRDGEYLEQVQTKIKNLARIDIKRAAQVEGEEPETVAVCYVLALSTIASMRGISLRECRYIVFDEFIKEPHERPLKEEYEAFKHAYETLNRNREMDGEPPMKVIALSNALDLANPYYRGLGIVNEIYKIRGEVWRDPEQGVAVYRPTSERFLEKKRQTVLYRLRGSEDTLGNRWKEMDLSQVRSMSMAAAIPLCGIEKVGFYKIHDKLYASATLPKARPCYTLDNPVDRYLAHERAQGVINALFDKRVIFESVDVMLRCSEMVKDL